MILERVHELCEAAVRSAFDTDPGPLTIDFTDKFGDLALNCFYLAKTLRQAPPKIAARIADAIDTGGVVAEAEAVSGYLNLTLDREALFRDALAPALANPEAYGSSETGAAEAQRIMVEFSAPNTNKPQHLGHVRNNCLGASISRILAAAGRDVVRTNLINDRGIHICKSMLAYREEGEGVTPESAQKKGDHLVGDFYVRFEQRFREEYEDFKSQSPENEGVAREAFFKQSRCGRAAQELLQLWEDGDEETVALWRTMNGWVIDGFNETYATLGIEFDKVYLESETYRFGKEIIDRGLEKGVFYRREDGAIEIDLTEDKLDKKVLLRSDGTSIYITQDLGSTVRKCEEHGLDGQIWVVGNEQIYHFKVLFRILQRLGYAWADNLYHLAYGMVNLPEGRMKSREGTVVDADELIEEVTGLARQEIEKKTRGTDTAEGEIDARSRRIGLAALKFMILNVSPRTTMTYDPKESVSFDGDTGPYVLYAYARIRRMIEDSGMDERAVTFDPKRLGDPSEVRVALKVLQFPEIVRRAAKDLNPSLVTTYLLQLARSYHAQYGVVKILKAEDPELRGARLALSLATANTLRIGLGLLGIETVDRM